MISAAFFLILATPTELPASAAKPVKAESKSCREMLLSSSRLGLVKVCKTRAGWRRFDDCHRSVTRYCSPRKKKESAVTLASANKDGVTRPHEGLRIVCKSVTGTGSRLSTQQVCMPKREWERMSTDANESLNQRIRTFSTQPNRGCQARSGC